MYRSAGICSRSVTVSVNHYCFFYYVPTQLVKCMLSRLLGRKGSGFSLFWGRVVLSRGLQLFAVKFFQMMARTYGQYAMSMSERLYSAFLVYWASVFCSRWFYIFPPSGCCLRRWLVAGTRLLMSFEGVLIHENDPKLAWNPGYPLPYKFGKKWGRCQFTARKLGY